ncbi:hypothetical protein [Trueperella pecoris]|uniref:Uncharacterized protein n=1 Tax=Trueperella pecoris TaxID=2733571 RepID=A0A7M1QSG4_9ACTO|nr:hypothetical protein [Trueperella pecoris]QOQ38492.1 hypothetical protein HLG82_02845 [Trueperella pecoris]QOR45020.1 hypothetical protein INS88_06940 [Trueperella pecoris]QTG74920.1 hypothetical protein J4179_06730 [Trueperella pecoris]
MYLSQLLARLAPQVHTPIQFSWPDGFVAEEWFEDDTAGEPLTVGGTLLRQSSRRTCGAMVALVSRMIMEEDFRIGLRNIHDVEARLFRDLRRGGFGPISWPASLGTPPWRLAHMLSARAHAWEGVPAASYQSMPVDTGTDSGKAVLQWVWHAVGVGLPVPLYTGGDIRGGLSRAVPRHVVLALPAKDDSPELSIYDPGSGYVYRVPIFSMAQRSTPLPAFGHWTHLTWAVLPQPMMN